MHFALIVLKLYSKSLCNKNNIQCLSEKPNTCASPDTQFLRILYPQIPPTYIGFFFFYLLCVERHDTVLSEIAYRRACDDLVCNLFTGHRVYPSRSEYHHSGDKLTRE